jgi:hypothetical protein
MTPAEWKRRIEALEEAARVARPAPFSVTIINDPEEGLEEFRIPNLDQRVCYEIGPLTQPGGVDP